jgi:ABC-type sulfate transport system substrate-binding protein
VPQVDAVVRSRPAPVARAADEFARFLFTTPAQREFAKLGFRVNPRVSKQAAEQQVG